MKYLYQDLLNKKQINVVDDTWALSPKFFISYKDVIEEAQPHNISSFKQIAIFDPYPNEPLADFEIPTQDLDFIYEDSRYKKDNSPNCIYIPSKKVMLKIMRACIGVKDEKDLWFQYQKD